MRLTSSRLALSPASWHLARTICEMNEKHASRKTQRSAIAHYANLLVFDSVKHTIGTKNLSEGMSRGKKRQYTTLTMAKSSASLERGKISGVAKTMGLREASPNPREVASMPATESEYERVYERRYAKET